MSRKEVRSPKVAKVLVLAPLHPMTSTDLVTGRNHLLPFITGILPIIRCEPVSSRNGPGFSDFNLQPQQPLLKKKKKKQFSYHRGNHGLVVENPVVVKRRTVYCKRTTQCPTRDVIARRAGTAAIPSSNRERQQRSRCSTPKHNRVIQDWDQIRVRVFVRDIATNTVHSIRPATGVNRPGVFVPRHDVVPVSVRLCILLPVVRGPVCEHLPVRRAAVVQRTLGEFLDVYADAVVRGRGKVQDHTGP